MTEAGSIGLRSGLILLLGTQASIDLHNLLGEPLPIHPMLGGHGCLIRYIEGVTNILPDEGNRIKDQTITSATRLIIKQVSMVVRAVLAERE